MLKSKLSESATQFEKITQSDLWHSQNFFESLHIKFLENLSILTNFNLLGSKIIDCTIYEDVRYERK